MAKKRNNRPDNKKQDAEALRLVMQLMAIPGGSGQEGAIVEFVTKALRRAGAPASAIRTDRAHLKTPIRGEVGNLIFKLPRRGSVAAAKSGRRLLAAHLDTVPICVGTRPLHKGRHVRSADPDKGLGADNRAGTAVLLSTALELLRGKVPHPPLTFLWTVQEEVGMQGARHVNVGMLGKPHLAFNWDGGAADNLIIGATGGYRMTIEVEGLASHAGCAPEEGVSAIAIASLAIADLVEGGWHGQIRKGRHQGTSNVGVIQGGVATNVVTDFVRLKAEARSHDTKFRLQIARAFEKAFTKAARQVRSADGRRGKAHFDGELDYESFCLARSEACVREAAAAVQAEGLEPENVIADGGLDANWLTAAGIPTVSLGCGQRDIHTVSEQLDVADFQRARRIAWRLATADY